MIFTLRFMSTSLTKCAGNKTLLKVKLLHNYLTLHCKHDSLPMLSTKTDMHLKGGFTKKNKNFQICRDVSTDTANNFYYDQKCFFRQQFQNLI